MQGAGCQDLDRGQRDLQPTPESRSGQEASVAPLVCQSPHGGSNWKHSRKRQIDCFQRCGGGGRGPLLPEVSVQALLWAPDMGLNTRGFPGKSLARPGARVLAKGSECRQGGQGSTKSLPSKSLSNSKRLCTESSQAGRMRS